MENSKILRWGILGTSFISHTVVQSIQGSSGSKTQAVFGRDEARLAKFAEKYSIGSQYTTIEALLDDKDVDVVYVGLPSHLHSQAVIAAAARGKAILSEKSLATTMDDSKAMIQAVEKANVFFLEGLMYLCHPLMEKVAEIVRSGALGKIRGMSGHYAANIWKKANPLGMGTIYNLGCYPVSLVHFILETAYGPDAFQKRQIQGLGTTSSDGVLHVRDAALVARFDAGVLATVQSTDSFGNDFGFAIQGDKATLRFRTNPWLPKAGENILEISQYGGATEQIVVNAEHDAFGYQVRKVESYVAAGVQQAARPSPSWANSVEIMDILTQWEKSILDSQAKSSV